MASDSSILAADTIDAELGLADEVVSAYSSVPKPDFTGSLAYIDSLASRSAVSISQRDLAMIATAASSWDYPLNPTKAAVHDPLVRELSVSADMRPLQDARLYHPEREYQRPVGLQRSSSDVIAPSYRGRITADFPPGWRNPLDPDRNREDLNRSMREAERRILRKPFAFREPDRVVICLKRKIRKQVLSAMGSIGAPYWMLKKPRRNYWSRVIC